MPDAVLSVGLRLMLLGYNLAAAAGICGVAEHTLRKAKESFAQGATVRPVVPEAPKAAGAGSVRLGQAGEAFLRELHAVNTSMYLREYVLYMGLAGFFVKKSTVAATLKRLRLTRKKVGVSAVIASSPLPSHRLRRPCCAQKTLTYRETPSQRYHAWQLKRWLFELGATADRIICLDETWKDAWDARRMHARSPANTEAIELAKNLYHSRRYCVLGATTVNGIIHESVSITRENITTEVFTAWFLNNLLPHLTEGDFVLMDNAPFHDFPTLTEACRLRGIWLLPTPPRRPKDNPIEYVWKLMKDYLLDGDFARFKADPEAAIRDALKKVPAAHVRSVYRHCGLLL